jgi:ferrous iron transport protein B
MLIGFGCTVPAVMSSRTLPSERDRRMTVILLPFMSCSAKLPIYGYFCNAFFPKQAGLIMVALYVIDIAIGILAALVFKNTLFKGEAVPFVMELPNYRMPAMKNVLQLMWDKAKDFLQRAFSIILIATIIVWFLRSFDFSFNLVEEENSMLAAIGGLIAPIFRPCGFGDWRVATALIVGFMAKESVAATLSVLFGSTAAITSILTPGNAFALLIFCLLYTPCIAAITSVRKELGMKWALAMVGGTCAIAWAASFITHLITLAI